MPFTGKVLALVLLSAVAQLARAYIFYNSNTQICCNDTVSNFPSSKPLSWTCCGSTAYDSTTSKCCSYNQVVQLPENGTYDDYHDYRCCYNEATRTSSVYQRSNQFCCNGKVLDSPENRYGCCNGKVYDAKYGLECCGDQGLFNRKTHLCCVKVRGGGSTEFRINKKWSNTSTCCGVEQYDFRFDVCCSSGVTPKTEDIDADSWGECCDDVPYDKKKKICCQKWSYNGSTMALYDKYQTTDCCGAASYDYRKEICCDYKKVVQKPKGTSEQWLACCGDQPMISSNTLQVCVKDKLYQREDFNYYICGGHPFNTRTQDCCGDRVLDKNSTLSCCLGTHVFDTTTHACCLNSVEPLTKEDIEAKNNACCHVFPYRNK